MSVECIFQANQQLSEGPLWLDDVLYWVDIKDNKLHWLDLHSSDHQSREFPEQITSISPRETGGFVVTLRHGFALLADLDAPISYLGDVEDLKSNRFNDAKVDPHGCLWAGTMDDGESEATGQLYRLDMDQTWECQDTDYVITNGPTFSPDGTVLYHTESTARNIYRFRLDANGITAKELFVQLDQAEGHPDGMTVDAEGCLWVCQYGGWGMTRFDPSGRRLQKIDLPVSNVTSCTFGGDDLRTLFVTTAAKGLPEDELAEQPLAGSIFKVRVETPGLPANKYQG